MAAFDPAEMLRVLADHEVRYLVVGGMAAAMHGSPHVTQDLDITPEMARENLGRLSEALDAMGARIRTDAAPEGLPFSHDAESLGRLSVLNMTTDHGDLDLTIMPAGTTGYDDLERDAVSISLLGIDIVVASLADVIRSKEAADRPKDHLTLPTLRQLLEEQQRRNRES